MHKILRFQDQGAQVLQLQSFLSQLGFLAGPPDGIFGFLTEKALIAFQRTYGLRPDGLAGAAIWRLLEQNPPQLQIPHQLATDESLSHLEAKYRLAPGLLAQINRHHLYPGATILIPQRKVLALWEPSSPFTHQEGSVSLVVIRGKWQGEELPFSAPYLLAVEFSWELVANKEAGKKWVEAQVRKLRKLKARGMLLRLSPGRGRYRRKLSAFLRLLAQELTKRELSLYLQLPGKTKEEPKDGENWSLDYRALGASATFVVVDLSQGEAGLSYSRFRDQALSYIKSVIPPWKLLPLVPESFATGETKQLLSLSEVRTLAKLVLYQKLGGLAFGGERDYTFGQFKVE